jgi:diacylglycerol kinase family enzyme
VRALLIVNPHATSADGRDLALVSSELSKAFDLETAETSYPSHAEKIAADAMASGFDLVMPFGGDGTVNEVVNGLMRGAVGDGAHMPALAPVPAGGANVFARSFGYPPDSVAAARLIAQASHGLAPGQSWRTIGLGLADERYFTFSAGIGVDAEVVREVNRLRDRGRHASPSLYMRAALRRYYLGTDRREPALTLYSEAGTPVSGLFMGVVTNSSPWTYLGPMPVSPVPQPDFSSGLDVFALRRLRTATTLRALRQMLHTRDRTPRGRDVLTIDGLCALTFRSRRPIALQTDGEYLGEVTELSFRYVPNALRVLALRPPG